MENKSVNTINLKYKNQLINYNFNYAETPDTENFKFKYIPKRCRGNYKFIYNCFDNVYIENISKIGFLKRREAFFNSEKVSFFNIRKKISNENIEFFLKYLNKFSETANEDILFNNTKNCIYHIKYKYLMEYIKKDILENKNFKILNYLNQIIEKEHLYNLNFIPKLIFNNICVVLLNNNINHFYKVKWNLLKRNYIKDFNKFKTHNLKINDRKYDFYRYVLLDLFIKNNFKVDESCILNKSKLLLYNNENLLKYIGLMDINIFSVINDNIKIFEKDYIKYTDIYNNKYFEKIITKDSYIKYMHINLYKNIEKYMYIKEFDFGIKKYFKNLIIKNDLQNYFKKFKYSFKNVYNQSYFKNRKDFNIFDGIIKFDKCYKEIKNIINILKLEKYIKLIGIFDKEYFEDKFIKKTTFFNSIFNLHKDSNKKIIYIKDMVCLDKRIYKLYYKDIDYELLVKYLKKNNRILEIISNKEKLLTKSALNSVSECENYFNKFISKFLYNNKDKILFDIMTNFISIPKYNLFNKENINVKEEEFKNNFDLISKFIKIYSNEIFIDEKVVIKTYIEDMEKNVKLFKRFWFLYTEDYIDNKILPSCDFLYEDNPIEFEGFNDLIPKNWQVVYPETFWKEINHHPIQKGKDMGVNEIPLALNIMIDIINITILMWGRFYNAFWGWTGTQAVIGITECVYEWLVLESSFEEQNNKESLIHYQRCYRWLRWEAEKVSLMARNDMELKGNLYVGLFIEELIGYMIDHHFDIMPIFIDVNKMDEWRNMFNKDLQKDIQWVLDKVKGIRHKLIDGKEKKENV